MASGEAGHSGKLRFVFPRIAIRGTEISFFNSFLVAENKKVLNINSGAIDLKNCNCFLYIVFQILTELIIVTRF